MFFATSLKKLNIEGTTSFTSNLLNADINYMFDEIRPDIVIHCAPYQAPML
jgi:dTDP-4-dehydrorhamnose reductase